MRGLIVIAAGFALAWGLPSQASPVGNPAGLQPMGNPGAWVTPADYPILALRGELEGTVGFRIKVGPDGVPTARVITQSSGHAELDAATCPPVMQRARFRPATDATGKTVPGEYNSRIRWVIPNGPGPAPPPSLVEVTFTIGVDGKATGCATKSLVGVPPEVVAPMLNHCNAAVYEPYRDKAGTPVARRVTSRLEIIVEPLP